MTVAFCPTYSMLADFFIKKNLQGMLFVKMQERY